MIALKTNPVGVDAKLQTIQQKLYDGLLPIWGNINSYDRVYKNQRESGFIFERYEDGEYKEVFLDDTIDGHFFPFIDSQKGFGRSKVSVVRWYFIVRVSTYSTNHRADQEARIDAEKHLRLSGFRVNNVVFSEELVWSGLSVRPFSDMQPWHVFYMEGNMTYSINEICKN